MKTLVVGLGNPILCDDGVGPQVAEELKVRLDKPEGRLRRPDVTVLETSMAGLSFLDLLTGYDKVIIVDAIQTEGGRAGQIYKLDPGVLDVTRHTASPHDINFATALELGKKLGLALPQQIVVFAVEAADTTTFSERCTPEVSCAIPACVEMIIQELNTGADP